MHDLINHVCKCSVIFSICILGLDDPPYSESLYSITNLRENILEILLREINERKRGGLKATLGLSGTLHGIQSNQILRRDHSPKISTLSQIKKIKSN